MFHQKRQSVEHWQQVDLQPVRVPHDDGHHLHLRQHVSDSGGTYLKCKVFNYYLDTLMIVLTLKVDGVLMINNKVFGIILGILVGFFSALIYFFFLLPQLLRMKGDLRISFALFSKKDRRGSGLAEVDDEKMTDSMEMAAENVKNHTLKEELEEEDESREVKLYLYTVSNYTISIISTAGQAGVPSPADSSGLLRGAGPWIQRCGQLYRWVQYDKLNL